MRTLVADDDRATALRLSRTLQRWGFTVTSVHDGEAAWQCLHNDCDYGLAIFDWMMPGADGLELCRRIRGDVRLAHMYVLLLTSRNSRSDLVTGLEAGADDYLIKPFDPDELRARVHVGQRILKLHEGLKERVAELEAAATKIRQLQGLLPICSYCKKVHTDANYWEQVEHYVAQHSDVQFSHGICPSCYQTVIQELEKGT